MSVNTFADPLRRALQVAPGKTAVVCEDVALTFAAFAERCARLSGALRALGLAKGDRVAILAQNSHRYLEVYVGVPAAGLVVVPLNTRHADPELVYALRDSGATVLITDRDPTPFRELVRRVVALPHDYEALVASHPGVALGADVTESDLAGLFYTGGTTGASKGVMLTHRNLIANTFHWMNAVPQREDDRVLVMAPLFHAAGTNGVLANLWTTGCQVVLPAFDAARALDLIEAHGITGTLGVPTMLAALAEEQIARPRRVDSVRVIAHGGSPIATEVIRRTHQAFPRAGLVEVYGATELSPLCTALHDEERLIDSPLARSCGRPIPGCDVRILTSASEEAPRGEVGEVVVRGPNVMVGYWKKPEQTAAVLKAGAYWTGDLGYMDADGYVFLVDRSKDMIVSGGENVYSTEVEDVLYRHPAVLEAAAFGVPDERWGEAVHAVVVPRPGFEGVDPAEIVAFCRRHIAAYKVPKAIDIRREPLPKSGPGKVLKRDLRAPFWAGRDRSVN
jgi:long-chain acyl-CoA synthetase